MTDSTYSRYCVQEKMKFVVFLTLGIFLLELVPRNLKPSEVKSVLKKVEGVEDLHELRVWNTSSEDLGISWHEMIKDQSIHSAQNILNQLNHSLRKNLGSNTPPRNLSVGALRHKERNVGLFGRPRVA
jgi:hypothetical protein